MLRKSIKSNLKEMLQVSSQANICGAFVLLGFFLFGGFFVAVVCLFGGRFFVFGFAFFFPLFCLFGFFC